MLFLKNFNNEYITNFSLNIFDYCTTQVEEIITNNYFEYIKYVIKLNESQAKKFLYENKDLQNFFFKSENSIECCEIIRVFKQNLKDLLSIAFLIELNELTDISKILELFTNHIEKILLEFKQFFEDNLLIAYSKTYNKITIVFIDKLITIIELFFEDLYTGFRINPIWLETKEKQVKFCLIFFKLFFRLEIGKILWSFFEIIKEL